jgi:ribonuclease HI
MQYMPANYALLLPHGNFILKDYNEGQGVGVLTISPNGTEFEMSSQLNYYCTNNQVKYEALLFGLEILYSMKVKHVEAFGVPC